MPIIINTSPYKTNGALTSKWCGIHSGGGVKFILQRTDFVVSSTSNSGGNTSINVVTGGVPALTVGGKVYLKLASGVAGLYTIISNTATAIVVNLAWTSSTTGYVNLTTDYSNYKNLIDFQYSTDSGATWIDYVSDAEFIPGPDQLFTVNLTPFVKDLVSIVNQTNNAGVYNDVMTSGSAYTRLAFTEEYLNQAGTPVSTSSLTSQTVYITLAAMQRNTNGNNMLSYVTDDVPTQLQNFLSDFAQPTWFQGFPFHLYWINSELTTSSLEIITSETGGTGTVNANTNIASPEGYAARLRLPITYPLSSTQLTVRLAKQGSHTAVSEIKTIILEPKTIVNPVYIKWLGLLGGWNYWCFEKRQLQNIKTSSPSGIFNPSVNALENYESDGDFIGKESKPYLTVYADSLTANDINGMMTLPKSPKVMMLIKSDGSPAGTGDWGTELWQVVRMLPSDHSFGDTLAYQRNVEFTLELIETYSQTN